MNLIKTSALLCSLTLTTMVQAQNPLFQDFNTPDHVPEFGKIKTEHYQPAIERGIQLAKAEIDAIANNKAKPTFENTIVALEKSGRNLDRANGLFENLLSAMSTDEMMAVSDNVTPMLAEFSTYAILNEPLWKRVQKVYDSRKKLNLNPEDSTLLEDTYQSFARNGANLQGKKKEEYKQLSKRLSELNNKFSQNVLKELNTYEFWLTKDDLAGLPEGTIEAAALAAKEKGREGEYLFTLDYPVYSAFMKYSDRDDLRKNMWTVYSSRNQKGEFNNLPIMQEIAETRLKIANLLGYKTYADYALVETMAENTKNVYNLLDQLRDAYRPALTRELNEIKEFAGTDITPWNYSYYANKLKNARYAFNEEELRPYFELSAVTKGIFDLAHRMYGITFEENKSIPVYHPEVKAYDVKDENGNYLAVLYTDFFPRSTKLGGAWMTNFRPQSRYDGEAEVRPLVSIVMNFTKPTETKPSLLTPYEVTTFMHEFGHALHGMLADGKYPSLTGTGVKHDFVELPSQFNENFFTNPEFLSTFARHYQTGEPIPADLVEKMIKADNFGQAYAGMRQLGFGYDDMAWHTITEPVKDPAEFEVKATETVEIFPPVPGTLFSPTFSHIFSGGYAAGYYGYKWAEVLAADAFEKFKETGVFNTDTAHSFRDNILRKGGSEHPSILYHRFRGQEPSVHALLKRDGIE